MSIIEMTPDEFEKIKDFATRFAAKLMVLYPHFKVSIVKFGPLDYDGNFWFQFIDLRTGMTEFFYANIKHDNDKRVDDAFAEYNKDKLDKDKLDKDKLYNPSKDLLDIYGIEFPQVLDETNAINMVKDGALENQEAGSVLYEEFTIHTPKEAPAEAPAAAAGLFTPLPKAKKKTPTLKAKTSFEIGQGLKLVQQTKPFLFPDYVACDNGSDATAVNQIIDGYNAVSEEQALEDYVQVADGFYAPNRPAKIPLAQMYELRSVTKKDEELTRPPNDFLRTGMIGFITSPRKDPFPFIIVIRGIKGANGYTSQTDFLFKGHWYPGDTLNPNIKEVAMGTHLPGDFKDSKGNPIIWLLVMNSLMRYFFKFFADLLLSIEKAFATHDALAAVFLGKKIEYNIDPKSCEINLVPNPDNTTLFLTRGSVKNKNTESKKGKDSDDLRFDAADKFFSNNKLRNKIKLLSQEQKGFLNKLDNKSLEEVIKLLKTLRIDLDDDDIDTLNDIMSEDSLGEKKLILTNFIAFVENTDSNVFRIGAIFKLLLGKEQINLMRQAEELKEFERKRALLLKEEDYLKESVTSAINESIEFILRGNTIHSYRQRKGYYDKKKNEISHMLASLVDSKLEQKKKGEIQLILASILQNSNLVEQNAFCKQALGFLETFSLEISREGVTFAEADMGPPPSSSSSSSSSVNTASEKYKSSIRRFIRRLLEPTQEFVDHENVKFELESILAEMMEQKRTLNKDQHKEKFDKIYELIQPTLTILDKKIEELTEQIKHASPTKKADLEMRLEQEKQRDFGDFGFTEGSEPPSQYSPQFQTPFLKRFGEEERVSLEYQSAARSSKAAQHEDHMDEEKKFNEQRLPEEVQTPGAQPVKELSAQQKELEKQPATFSGSIFSQKIPLNQTAAKAAEHEDYMDEEKKFNEQRLPEKVQTPGAQLKPVKELSSQQKELEKQPATFSSIFSKKIPWNQTAAKEAQQQIAAAQKLTAQPGQNTTNQWNKKATQKKLEAQQEEEEEPRGQKRVNELPPLKKVSRMKGKVKGSSKGGSRRPLHRKKNNTQKITRKKTRKAKKMRGLRKSRRRT